MDRDPEVADRGGLEVRVRDAALRRDLAFRPDLLVLSAGIAPGPDNPALSGLLRTSLTADGFFLEAHPKLRPVDLASEGIFVCGLAHSPRFIDETIAQARAAAARAATILSHATREVPGQVSRIDALKCVACMTCVKVCPYGAPGLNEETRKAEIQGAVCMGCGSCAAVCPAKAITLQHQEDRQVVAMLDELLPSGGGTR
jgi:heterodisulfide reductase subunit A